MTSTERAKGAAGIVSPPMGAASLSTLDPVWRVLAFVGVAISASAVISLLPAWLPPRFGNVDWEFATMADVAAVLPLLAIGFGGCLVAATGLRRRRALLGLGIGFVLVALVLIACLLVFATTAVIAIRNTQGGPLPVVVGVRRIVARTLWSDLVGLAGCVAAAVASFKFYLASRTAPRA